MSNLLAAISRINSLIIAGETSYVYFNKRNGDVNSISNAISETDLDYIEVDHDEVKTYFTGETRLTDYKVKYNPQIRNYVLIKQDIVNYLTSVEDYLYQIPFSGNAMTNLEHIYTGIEFAVYVPNMVYYKGQHVWCDNIIYKLDKNISSEDLITDQEIFLEDVVYIEPKMLPSVSRKNRNGTKVLISNKLYMVNATLDTDFYIYKNNLAKEWQVYVSRSSEYNAKLTSVNITNKIINLYVTQHDDPNMLIRTIEVPVKEIQDKTKIKYDYEYDSEMGQLSIYTPKLYESYQFEEIT